MQKINVGFDIELETLIKSRMLIQANSGGGKSYLIRKLIEEIHGKVPFIVLDLEGEFTSIREKYDVILFGQGHDVPINIQYADKLARYLLELRASAIIDLSELMQHERILFVRRFLESMMNAPKNLWNQTAVFIDEAHIFCPEDSKAESGAAVIDLCTRGRKRGYCAILATQRISKLRKDAVAEMNNKIIGRTGMDVDVKRTAFELGMTSGDAQKMLPHLREGEFYVFGPAISRVVRKEKVSKVRTTHGETGVKHTKPVPPSNAIQKIIARIADIPKEVEKEKDLVKILQEENKTLKGQLKNQKPVTIPVKNNEEVIELKKNLTSAKKTIDEYEKRDIKIRTGIGQNIKGLNALIGMPEIKLPEIKIRTFSERTQPSTIHHVHIQSEQRPISHDSDSSNGSLPKGEKAVLISCAQFPNGLYRNQITVLTQYKRSSRDAYIQRLKEKYFVSSKGDKIMITEVGLHTLGNNYQPLPTGEALREHWLNTLPKGEKLMLELISAVYPQSITREELTEKSDYQRSSRDAYLQRMLAKEIIEVTNKGEVKASDSLFE